MELEEKIKPAESVELYGNFEHSLDSKGRIIVPARFRKDLGEKFMVAKGLTDKNLILYPLEQWNILVRKLDMIPKSDRKGAALKRRIIGNAEKCLPDKQGKIILPEKMRTYAEITKNVTIVGMGSYVEIWNSDTWNEIDTDDDLDSLCLSIEKYGI